MKKPLKLLLAFVFVFLGAKTGAACTCIVPPEIRGDSEKHIKYEFDKSAAVFSGKVIRTSKVKNSNAVRVKFSVEKIWKGGKTKTVVVETGSSEGLCGYAFRVGKKYIVYARELDSKNLTTTRCTRTDEEKNAAEDIRHLSAMKTTDEKN